MKAMKTGSNTAGVSKKYVALRDSMNKAVVSFFLIILARTISLLAQSPQSVGDTKVSIQWMKIPVTIQVNMGSQIRRGAFFPGSDSVLVRGDFQTDAGDVQDWEGGLFTLLPASPGDSIYRVTVKLPRWKQGKQYNYNFYKRDTIGERIGSRRFVLGKSAMVLSPVYYDNDSSYFTPKFVTATVTFLADLRKIWGSGNGYYDETTDSLVIEGLGDWDCRGRVLSGSRRLQLINPTSTGIYSSTLVIKGIAGDSTQYQYQAFPANRYLNAGLEKGIPRYYKFPYSDSLYKLPNIIPAITPANLLLNEVTVLFSVHFSDSAKNAKNGQLIPKKNIQWIGVKGSIDLLGGWGGNWTAADTNIAPGNTYPTMYKLNDSGYNGDAIPGDGVWSRKIIFPIGAQGGLVEYKYGCMYPGADTVNGGVSPLDNEYVFQIYHQFMLVNPKVGNTINLGNLWGYWGFAGEQETPVTKEAISNFRLEQNYPNPFNPSTQIRFMIPEESRVMLKVYSVLGKEVATLINQTMKAGSYEQSFDASSLSAGVYIYQLTAGDHSTSRKMLYLK